MIGVFSISLLICAFTGLIQSFSHTNAGNPTSGTEEVQYYSEQSMNGQGGSPYYGGGASNGQGGSPYYGGSANNGQGGSPYYGAGSNTGQGGSPYYGGGGSNTTVPGSGFGGFGPSSGFPIGCLEALCNNQMGKVFAASADPAIVPLRNCVNVAKSKEDLGGCFTLPSANNTAAQALAECSACQGCGGDASNYNCKAAHFGWGQTP